MWVGTMTGIDDSGMVRHYHWGPFYGDDAALAWLNLCRPAQGRFFSIDQVHHPSIFSQLYLGTDTIPLETTP